MSTYTFASVLLAPRLHGYHTDGPEGSLCTIGAFQDRDPEFRDLESSAAFQQTVSAGRWNFVYCGYHVIIDQSFLYFSGVSLIDLNTNH